MEKLRNVFVLCGFSLVFLPGVLMLVEYEVFELCQQYSYLTQGNWTQLFGKKWYLYQTSSKDEQSTYQCVQYQYSGVTTLQEKAIYEKGTYKNEEIRYPKNFYLLNITNEYAVTLECSDYGFVYINKVHILTSTRPPANITKLQNFTSNVFNTNGILFKMYTVEQNCD